MALSELAALDAAYQTLRPLDPAARRRALQWLADALAAEAPRIPSTPSTAPIADADPPAAVMNPQPTSAATTRASAARPAKRTAGQPRRRATTPTGTSATGAVPEAATSSRTRGSGASRTSSTARGKQTTARQNARPYRRMPPADEVMAAYRRVGSVSGLADHFSVPGHTVQGWARQLRRHGYAIGRIR
jgi:hypothetical protein